MESPFNNLSPWYVKIQDSEGLSSERVKKMVIRTK